MAVQHDLTEEELRAFAEQGVVITNLPSTEDFNDPAPAADAAPVTADPAPSADAAPVTPPAGESAPAADAAPATPPADAAAPVTPPPGFVPHAALHQERTARQQQAQQMALLQARTNALLAAQAPAAPEMPDMNADPAGYIQALHERLEAFETERRQEQQFREIDTAIGQDEALFMQFTPDYDAASNHYVQSRAQELLSLGFTPQQAQATMMNEARQMAQQAWQQGVPAAQMVYSMAQARGYRTGAPQTAQPAQQQAPALPVPPQGQQPSPVTPQTPSAAAIVAAAQQGQQATRTLSNAGGTGGTATMNAEALLSMSDEEFEAYLKLGTKGANARFAAIG